MKYICEQCGKTYRKRPAQQEKNRHYLCSSVCVNKFYAPKRGSKLDGSKPSFKTFNKLTYYAHVRKQMQEAKQ
jgi:hypothetical protein